MNAKIKAALVAANAANASCAAAKLAESLLETAPSAWGLADAAYWLCRAAQKAAEDAALALDPDNPNSKYAHTVALKATQDACEHADHLVSLANAAGREIRR